MRHITPIQPLPRRFESPALFQVFFTTLSSAISVGSHGYSPPVANSTCSSSVLGALTSLSSSSPSTPTSTSTFDDYTKSTSSSQYPSSAVLSSTASSYESGGLSSLSTSNSTNLTSSVSLTAYTSSPTTASSTPGSIYIASTSVPLYSSTIIPTPTVSSKTSTNTSSSVYVAPTKCGEQGNFVLNVSHQLHIFSSNLLISHSLMTFLLWRSATRARILSNPSRSSTPIINSTSLMGLPSYLHLRPHTTRHLHLCSSSSFPISISMGPIHKLVPTLLRKEPLVRFPMAMWIKLVVSASTFMVLPWAAIRQVQPATSFSLDTSLTLLEMRS